jgi:hypothetical protein
VPHAIADLELEEGCQELAHEAMAILLEIQARRRALRKRRVAASPVNLN